MPLDGTSDSYANTDLAQRMAAGDSELPTETYIATSEEALAIPAHGRFALVDPEATSSVRVATRMWFAYEITFAQAVDDDRGEGFLVDVRITRMRCIQGRKMDTVRHHVCTVTEFIDLSRRSVILSHESEGHGIDTAYFFIPPGWTAYARKACADLRREPDEEAMQPFSLEDILIGTAAEDHFDEIETALNDQDRHARHARGRHRFFSRRAT